MDGNAAKEERCRRRKPSNGITSHDTLGQVRSKMNYNYYEFKVILLYWSFCGNTTMKYRTLQSSKSKYSKTWLNSQRIYNKSMSIIKGGLISPFDGW